MKLFAMKSLLIVAAATVVLGITPAQAGDDTIYGRELMAEQERNEHRQKMRTLQGEEREAYRKEQHEKMEKRAEEKGTKIPDEPGERGKGVRQGAGSKKSDKKGKGYGSGKRQGKGH